MAGGSNGRERGTVSIISPEINALPPRSAAEQSFACLEESPAWGEDLNGNVVATEASAESLRDLDQNGVLMEAGAGKVTEAETLEGGKGCFCKLEEVLGWTGVRLDSERPEEAVEMVPEVS